MFLGMSSKSREVDVPHQELFGVEMRLEVLHQMAQPDGDLGARSTALERLQKVVRVGNEWRVLAIDFGYGKDEVVSPHILHHVDYAADAKGRLNLIQG